MDFRYYAQPNWSHKRALRIMKKLVEGARSLGENISFTLRDDRDQIIATAETDPEDEEPQ